MEVEVNITKPVALGGLSFIKMSFAILASKDKELVANHKKELSRLLNNLLKALQGKFGKDAFVAINYSVIAEDNTKEPKDIVVRKIMFWEPVKIIQEPIEASL